MDFFGRQAAARRLSRWLLVAFLLAAVAVTVAVNLVVLVLVASLGLGGAGLYLTTRLENVQTVAGPIVGTLVGTGIVGLIAWLVRRRA